MSAPETPDPIMQALAEAAAAQIARKHIEWIGDSVRIDGPIYRQIEGAAVPAILAVLEQLRFHCETPPRAKGEVS